MSTPLRVLAALFDIETGTATAKLDQLSSGLNAAKGALSTVAATAFGAFSFHSLKEFIQGQIDAAKEVRLTSQKLGVSTDFLEEWTFAAGTAGVSAEGAANGLKFLNKNMGEAIEGQQEAVQTFTKMGVALKDADGNVRELDDVLPEVADSFAKMGSQQERTTAAMKLFGRQGADLLPLLQQGSAGVDQLRERFHQLGGGMSDDFIAKAKDAGKAMGAAKFGLSAFKRAIAYELFPYVIQFAEKAQTLTGYLVKLSKETNIVKEIIGALGVASAAAAVKTAYHWTKVLGLFPQGASLFKSLFSLGALAAVVLLAAAVEDLVVMCQGGESVIGDFFDKMGMGAEKKDLIESLTNAWADMKVPLQELGPLAAQVGTELAKALPYVIGLVADLIKGLMTVGSFLFNIGKAIGELATGGSLSDATKHLDEWGKQTVDRWKGGSTLAATLRGPTEGSVPAPAAPALADSDGSWQYRQGGTNAAGPTVNGGINITVNGGPSNEDTGKTVRRAAAAALARGTSGDE